MSTISRPLVLVPIYNEEGTVREVLVELRRYYSGDVLVVDDGSTDRSIARIEENCLGDIAILKHDTNQGYGSSLIDGFQYAIENGYDLVITMDCDCQHEPSQVPGFLEFPAEVDILSGSRYLNEASKNGAAPADRMQINQIITGEINEITGFGITDAFCGFKAYRVAALQQLILSEFGYGFPLQLWLQAKRSGLRVAELPVARIYNNLDRSFGEELDDPDRRLSYYRRVIAKELVDLQPCSLT